MRLCFYLSSLYLFYWGTVFLALVEQMVAGFHSSPLLSMFTKSINKFTLCFGTFSLFMIPFTRGMLWSPTVLTVLTKLLVGRFVLCAYYGPPKLFLILNMKNDTNF